MSIKMIGEQVLVAAAPKEEKTAGGIILSSEVKQTASEPGIVMAIGPEVTTVLPKDVVYLSWDKSMPVRISGQDAVIVAAEHIKAVLS
jgi:co-chaperonin GroES (HSP10)